MLAARVREGHNKQAAASRIRTASRPRFTFFIRPPSALHRSRALSALARGVIELNGTYAGSYPESTESRGGSFAFARFRRAISGPVASVTSRCRFSTHPQRVCPCRDDLRYLGFLTRV